MDQRTNWLTGIICVGWLATNAGGTGGATAGSGNAGVLQVHLPREVTVEDNLVSLSEISIMRGPSDMVAKASKIGLGRFSLPGQKVVLNRPIILSRLATAGIPSTRIRLTGAESVTVKRQQEIVQSEDFIAAAEQFIRQYPGARLASRIIPVIRPKDLVLAELPEPIKLTPRFARRGTRGNVTVEVTVTAGGQHIGTRDISFRLRYERHQVVALDQIPEGTVLGSEHVKIETVESDQVEPAGWKPPYGQATQRTIPAGAVIRADMLGSPPSEVFVRRNATVQIRLELPGILVTAMGTALQEAHAGECLKVRNTDSNRIILCQLKPDGTVEPML